MDLWKSARHRIGWSLFVEEMMKMHAKAAIITLFLSAIPVSASAAPVECEGRQYMFEDGLFGASAKVLHGEEWRDFCVSQDPETISQDLKIHKDEVWCLSLHHITAESRPFARSTWMLKRSINVLQMTEYLQSTEGWQRQKSRRVKCRTVEESEQ